MICVLSNKYGLFKMYSILGREYVTIAVYQTGIRNYFKKCKTQSISISKIIMDASNYKTIGNTLFLI